MLNIFQALFLGVIQGITEWLPVSSSGHLAVVQHYIGLDVPIAFDVLLHVATLLVILVAFRGDIKSVIVAAVRRDFKSPEGRLFLMVIIGCVPTALIGFSLQAFFESMFNNMALVGGALIFTGVILVASRNGSGERRIGKGSALLVGIAQGFAVAPGISRSGSTIGAALFTGIERRQAISFSFLLAIPAIIGAMAFKFDELVVAGIGVDAMITGFIASLVVGYVSLKLLIRTIMNKKFSWFAVYCFVLGFVLVLSSLVFV